MGISLLAQRFWLLFGPLAAGTLGMGVMTYQLSNQSAAQHTAAETIQHLWLYDTSLNMILVLCTTLLSLFGVSSFFWARTSMRKKMIEDELRYRDRCISSAGEAIVMTDANSVIKYANPAFYELTGYSETEVIGQGLKILKSGTHQQTFYDRMEHVIATGQTWSGEITNRKKDHTLFHAHVTIAPVFDDDKHLEGFIAIQRDITESKQNAHKLKESEERYRTLVELSPDAIIIHQDGRIVFSNTAGATMMGAQSVQELIGRPVLDFVHPEYRALVTQRMQQMCTGEEVVPMEEKFIRLDQTVVSVEVAAMPFVFNNRSAVQVIARDITEHKRLESALKKMAHFDDLTGLPNRTLFFERLKQLHTEAERYERSYALLYLDLDGFKAVNDTHGHDIGDTLLREAAARITACLRESDTVARLGGDEFVVILPELATASMAEQVAKKIIAQLQTPFVMAACTCEVSVSIGIALYPHDSQHYEELIRQADHAMYHIKARGKNSFEHAKPRHQTTAPTKKIPLAA